MRNLTPEQLILFKSLVLRGASKRDLQVKFRAGFPQIKVWLDMYGLETTCKMGPPKKKHTGQLVAWKPPSSHSLLEVAVDSLRAKLKAPVFAENTRKRPHEAPKPYTPQTVFIVGNRRMTGAEIMEAV